MTTDHGNATTNSGFSPVSQLWTYEHDGIKYPSWFAAHPKDHLPNVKNMKCEQDDVIVCSYPKSG